MNRQGNTYTIIYAAALVILVGVALSVVYQLLKPAQDENIANDTRRQILASAMIVPGPDDDVAALYDSHIVRSFLVDSKGNEVKGETSPFEVNLETELGKPENERKMPVFECRTESGLKYILPVRGRGLWGPIWGYVAMDSDGSTIYGAFFAHQGETPGLGAEIEKPAFRDQFEGKSIFAPDGSFSGVKVVKNGKEPKDGSSYVHAVSGGTITSQGVQAMLQTSLAPYVEFLKKLKG